MFLFFILMNEIIIFLSISAQVTTHYSVVGVYTTYISLHVVWMKHVFRNITETNTSEYLRNQAEMFHEYW